jgi:YtkA-like
MTSRSHPPRPRARRHGPVAALVAAVLLAGCAAAPAHGDGPESAADTAGALVSLSTRPSHDGHFRAGVVHRTRSAPGTPESWTVRVTDAAGAPVQGARIGASAWMPAADARPAAPGWTAAELGGGRYRIDGLRFPREGWWNVPFRITAGAWTDSLAFNLVLTGSATRGGGAGR